jgi:hypothetical protein
MRGWIAWRTLLDAYVRYRRKGFEVVVPEPDNGIDLLLTKDNEMVVIQVKSSASDLWIRNRPYPDTNRFDTAGKDVHVDVIWIPVGGLVNIPDIESRIDSAEQLAAQGRLEAGFLLAFAALEAAALRVASTLVQPLRVQCLGRRLYCCATTG